MITLKWQNLPLPKLLLQHPNTTSRGLCIPYFPVVAVIPASKMNIDACNSGGLAMLTWCGRWRWLVQ